MDSFNWNTHLGGVLDKLTMNSLLKEVIHTPQFIHPSFHSPNVLNAHSMQDTH